MVLAFDIGNTNIKIGLFDGDRLVFSWRVATDLVRTADEYGIAEGALEPVTFAWATPLTGEDATFEVAGKSYKRVSTNYLLIGGNTLHSDALNIDIAFSNKASGNGTTRELFTFNAVPVERNHRTNIVGTLLTSPANREIVVNP